MLKITEYSHTHNCRTNKGKEERHDDGHERQIERRIFFDLSTSHSTNRNIFGGNCRKTQDK